MQIANAIVTRQQVEDFLYMEASLLDDWKLSEWIALFTDDATYLVPSGNAAPDASPDTTLFFIADNRFRLNERVIRLNKKSAHSEFPRSKTRHFVSNVMIVSRDGDELDVRAGFSVYRFKDETHTLFVGCYSYRLLVTGDTFRIREKRCVLDSDGLRPQGRISILL